MTDKLITTLQMQIATLEAQRDSEIKQAIAEDYSQNVAPKQAELEAAKEAELQHLAAENEQKKAQLQAAYEAAVAAVVQKCENDKKAIADKSEQTVRYTAGVEYDNAIARIRELLPKE